VIESLSRRAPPFQGSVSPDQHKSARAWRYGNPQIAQETQGRALGAAHIRRIITAVAFEGNRWVGHGEAEAAGERTEGAPA
jgi:hypothetical protein